MLNEIEDLISFHFIFELGAFISGWARAPGSPLGCSTQSRGLHHLDAPLAISGPWCAPPIARVTRRAPRAGDSESDHEASAETRTGENQDNRTERAWLHRPARLVIALLWPGDPGTRLHLRSPPCDPPPLRGSPKLERLSPRPA